jgi:hypothetical protein
MSEKPKKREAASWQAQVGFYLSLVLAVFQVYQYFHSERETQIAASIDVARKYFSDPDFNKGRNIAAKVMRGTELHPVRLTPA